MTDAEDTHIRLDAEFSRLEAEAEDFKQPEDAVLSKPLMKKGMARAVNGVLQHLRLKKATAEEERAKRMASMCPGRFLSLLPVLPDRELIARPQSHILSCIFWCNWSF